ncbi:MAG: N-acetylglucosamine-6-phosphate deacetylase [Oscillospiraceae bacterium]|nr:N-acetylglucosamine-6-phosphate deacetylase [Oscillospiraceae bacterium]
MKIIGGNVFGSDHQMHNKELCFENGIITESSAEGVYDATDCYVLPGLIDTHIHGARGIGFYWSKENLLPALDWLTQQGITGILPTTCSETPEELEEDIRRLATFPDDRILGIHAEGPFLNPANRGGMRENRIQPPNVDTLQRMYDASEGKLRILTIAPEMEGADAVIDRCLELGVQVSMGHTSASYACANAAVNRGVTRLTHTFNGMRGFNHREPGVLGCGLEDDRVMCELICDLYHVTAPAIRLAIRTKGHENITMISDGSRFSGVGDGEYFQGDRILYVKDGLCTLADGTISGSSRCLSDGAQNLFRLGYTPAQIAVMAAVNPAKACGCTDRGELIPGCRADIVVFDEAFRVKAVFLKGQQVV